MPHIDAGMLQAWLDGETDEAENRRVESHLEHCEQCRVGLDEAARIGAQASEIVAEVAPLAMPEWSELLARAERAEREPGVATTVRPGPQLIPVLAWAATLVLAFTLGWYGRWPLDELPTPERQVAALEEVAPGRQAAKREESLPGRQAAKPEESLPERRVAEVEDSSRGRQVQEAEAPGQAPTPAANRSGFRAQRERQEVPKATTAGAMEGDADLPVAAPEPRAAAVTAGPAVDLQAESAAPPPGPAAASVPRAQAFLPADEAREAPPVRSASLPSRPELSIRVDPDALPAGTLVLGEAKLVTAAFAELPAALDGAMGPVVLQLVFDDPAAGALVTLLQPAAGLAQLLSSSADRVAAPSARRAPVPPDNNALRSESSPGRETLIVLPDNTKALQWSTGGRLVVLIADVEESVLRQLRLRVR